MKLTWFGHAAFGVVGTNRARERVRIVLDPYNYPGCGGYEPINAEADVVSISHVNVKYHSDTSSIRGSFQLVDGLSLVGEPREVCGVTFEATRVYENDRGEGPNAMVKFALDGITVAHQGDLGHALSDDQLRFLDNCDVLLALAGGNPTLDLTDLRQLVDAIRPALVVPMHFKTPKVNLKILPVDAFLKAFADLPTQQPGRSSIDILPETLPDLALWAAGLD